MSGCRYLAILQYDGTSFHGWQRQATGRTVQGEFENVLQRLFQQRTVTHAAGRTDAGVHALGQGVSFDAPAGWDASALRRAVNALVPGDVWISEVRPVWDGFHARKSAVSRRYRYIIGTDAAAESPFRRPFEWALRRSLDRRRLEEAAAKFTGTHEFAAYAARGTPQRHFRCTVLEARWLDRPNDAGVVFEIEADRFLHHMVRFLVGTMVDVASDRRPAEDVDALLLSTDNQQTSPPAPPQGLYFLSVRYPDHPPA